MTGPADSRGADSTGADRDLVERIKAEVAAAAPPNVALILDPQEALVLLGNLQLALRHAGNMGGSAEIALAIARKLEAYLAFSPALAEVAARGWRDAGNLDMRN
jgi:hypothetical protein